VFIPVCLHLKQHPTVGCGAHLPPPRDFVQGRAPFLGEQGRLFGRDFFFFLRASGLFSVFFRVFLNLVRGGVFLGPFFRGFFSPPCGGIVKKKLIYTICLSPLKNELGGVFSRFVAWGSLQPLFSCRLLFRFLSPR